MSVVLWFVFVVTVWCSCDRLGESVSFFYDHVLLERSVRVDYDAEHVETFSCIYIDPLIVVFFGFPHNQCVVILYPTRAPPRCNLKG